MDAARAKQRINLYLMAMVALNLAFWLGSHHFTARWAGVPPVPSKAGAVMMTLGDPEFSFRSGALTLQNLGDGGGRVTPLWDYDYKKLGKWFDLLNDLDPASEHVPTIAAHYFGGVRDRAASTAVVVDYLTRIGQNPAGEKWRWLTQAAFLAQHRMGDLHRALDIAYALSKMKLTDGRELPAFAREYPAFVLKARGENETARLLMEQLLLTEENPTEANFIKHYLIDQLHVDPKEVEAIMKMRNDPKKP